MNSLVLASQGSLKSSSFEGQPDFFHGKKILTWVIDTKTSAQIKATMQKRVRIPQTYCADAVFCPAPKLARLSKCSGHYPHHKMTTGVGHEACVWFIARRSLGGKCFQFWGGKDLGWPSGSRGPKRDLRELVRFFFKGERHTQGKGMMSKHTDTLHPSKVLT